jgi:hypothetical protein
LFTRDASHPQSRSTSPKGKQQSCENAATSLAENSRYFPEIKTPAGGGLRLYSLGSRGVMLMFEVVDDYRKQISAYQIASPPACPLLIVRWVVHHAPVPRSHWLKGLKRVTRPRTPSCRGPSSNIKGLDMGKALCPPKGGLLDWIDISSSHLATLANTRTFLHHFPQLAPGFIFIQSINLSDLFSFHQPKIQVAMAPKKATAASKAKVAPTTAHASYQGEFLWISSAVSVATRWQWVFWVRKLLTLIFVTEMIKIAIVNVSIFVPAHRASRWDGFRCRAGHDPSRLRRMEIPPPRRDFWELKPGNQILRFLNYWLLTEFL